MNEFTKLKLEFLTGLKIIKEHNNTDVMLSNITIWKEVLEKADVEERHYIEAYQELLDTLKENPKHIETFWRDFETCVQHLESMVEIYKDDELSDDKKSVMWANITLPMSLLAVMWIYNHPKFNGDLYEFEGTEHFNQLRAVLE